MTDIPQMGQEIEPKVEQPEEAETGLAIQSAHATMRDSANVGSHQDATEPPREGTLAWLQQQPHVDVLGLSLPHCHRVPEGSTLAEANGYCRIVTQRGRCRAPATRLYGICVVHAGGGGATDPEALRRMSAKGHAAKTRLRIQRQTLGIGPNRVGNPREHARIQAMARAERLAEALLAPLDDEALSSLAQQRAAVTVLDATFPLQQATVELELPAEEAGVQALGWEQMQALAARLLDEQ